MLNRLVAMRILPHARDLHFAYLVNDASIITIIEYRGHNEDRIQHLHKGLFASHQVDQTLYIMKNAPAIMPAIPFRKCITPFEWIERGLKAAVFIFPPHQ